MNTNKKALWIVGDSFATFDRSDGTHWINYFAKHKGCEVVYNLARGGFDTKAICFTGKEIISNRPWPGRTIEQEFNRDQDIIVVFSTMPDRVCHKAFLDSEFKTQDSIANLNWYVPGLVWFDKHGNPQGDQEPMPWQDHMPQVPAMYSQNLSSILELERMEQNTEQDINYIENILLYHDWQWEEQITDLMIHGLYHYHETHSTGSEMWITGNCSQKRPGVNYIPCVGDYQRDGLMPNQPPADEICEYNEQTLVNHHTPEDHNVFWELLKPTLV